MSRNHISDLKFRMMSVDLIRMAKKDYTYREISLMTKLPVTVLNRYVKGHVLPSSKRAVKIWQTLEKLIGLEKELKNRIKFNEDGYFDNTSIISDVSLLQHCAQYIIPKFAGKRITKILTAAVDGLPFATILSEVLSIPLIIAKKNKEIGVKEFIEENFIAGNSAIITSFYIPKNQIKKGDSVLIVDDVIKSGEDQRALIKIVQKSKADAIGVCVLITVGEKWKEIIKEVDECPINAILAL